MKDFRKVVLSVLSCFLLLDGPLGAQTILRTSPADPLTYETREGRLKVLTSVVLDRPLVSGAAFRLDGTAVPWTATGRPDSVLVWTPMVDESNLLEILVNGKCVSSVRIPAPVRKDWGVFQNGEIHIIQSSHQDIAWMDTPEYCRNERIEDIIIPALDMMREDPDFTFEMEQTLNLMEFLEAHPERKEEVIRRYQEGRFNWGATFNQCYEGLSSGEQLVRQAYFGRKWIRENLPGCDDRTANNMDVPGRTLQMPQILSKSGIPHLFISRMHEGLYDWYSPDGSSVRTFSVGHYGWETMVWHFFDLGVLHAFRKVGDRLRLWEDYYRERHLPPTYAILVSNDASKPESFTPVIRAWNDIADKSEVPLPHMKYSTAEAFFSVMDDPRVQARKIAGERPNLWLYIHGPAHYDETLDKRRAAVALPAAEFFSTVHALDGNDYPRAELDRGWMASIYPDHGQGGKNGEITDRIFADSLAVARKIGEELTLRAAQGIAGKVKGAKGDRILFNDLPWDRCSVAEVYVGTPEAVVKNANGERIPSQCVRRGDSTFVRFLASVPGMGYAKYQVVPSKGKAGPSAPEGVLYGANHYSNAYYEAILGDGGIVRLYDRQLGKDVMAREHFSFGDIIDVKYAGNGAGEFVRITDVTPTDMSALHQFPAHWRIVEEGPLSVRFENRVKMSNTTVVQRITFYHTVKKIDFDITLEDFNGAQNRQFRILFPTNQTLRDADVVYEVPMAVSHVGQDELDMVPMGYSGWGTYVHHPEDSHPREVGNFISSNGNGLGVTMSSCVAVCDWIDPSREVADYPVLQGILLSSHKSCHHLGNWYHQTGTHEYHFTVTTHPEGWKNGYAMALEENHPFTVAVKENRTGTMPSSHSYLDLSDPLVWISTLKKADDGDGIILRLVEMEGVDKEVTVRLPFEAASVARCNLVEEETGPAEPVGSDVVKLRLGHHAIETFRFRRP